MRDLRFFERRLNQSRATVSLVCFANFPEHRIELLLRVVELRRHLRKRLEIIFRIAVSDGLIYQKT